MNDPYASLCEADGVYCAIRVLPRMGVGQCIEGDGSGGAEMLEEDSLVSEELSPPSFESFNCLLPWESYYLAPTDNGQVNEVWYDTRKDVPADIVLRNSGANVGAGVKEWFLGLILRIDV